MSIYIVLPNLSAGGAERVSITIARLLRKAGYNVEFLNLGTPQGEMQSWIQPEFKISSFNFRRVIYALPRLYSFMKDNPDSLFFSSREHVNVASLLSAKLIGRSVVVRIPNMPRNVLIKGVSGLKMRIIKIINRWLLKSAKIVIAQNEEMRRQLLEYYSLPSDKVIAINNPVDKDYIISSSEGYENPYRQGEISFLSICNISYSKGIDVLIEAWPIVKKTLPNAHMYIIGRDNSEYAKGLIEKSKSLKDFSFLGFIANPYPYLRYCDTFVLPSRMEGFPNVVLEAMCFNKPIASTTCVAVIRDIIKWGINGYYCDVETPKGLADCMISAASLTGISNNYAMFDEELLINCFR